MADPDQLCHREKPFKTFYGNACAFCFRGDVDLMVCRNCKFVRYCGEHCMRMDLRDHQRICAFLAEREIKSNTSDGWFFCDNLNFMHDLEKYVDEHHNGLPLTHFEKEVCLLPWVCVVCHSSQNLYAKCFVCRSVAYCCIEHEKRDEINHQIVCHRLFGCKVLFSLGYKHPYKIDDHKYEYKSFREKEKTFPVCRDDLLKLIRFRPKVGSDQDEMFNTRVFFNKFAGAATILNCLKKIGMMHRRFYLWPSDKELRLLPNTKNKYTGTLVIHMLLPEDYEFRIKWNQFTGLILDWLKNVSHIKIVFIGNNLSFNKFLALDRSNSFVTYEIYNDVAYQDIEGLERPDLIVFFSYSYPKLTSCKEILNPENIGGIFRFPNVPVIITSIFQKFLLRVDKTLKDHRMTFKSLCNVSFNPFADCTSVRFWDDKGIQVGHFNEYVAVYKREK